MKTNLDIALMWFTAATIFSLPFFFVGTDFPTAFLEAAAALTSVGITNISNENPMYFYRAFLSFFGGILFLITLPKLINTSDSFKFAIHENISVKKLIRTYILLFVFGVILYFICGENLYNAGVFSALTVSTTGSVVLPANLIQPANILMFFSIIFPLLYIIINFKVSIISVFKREQFKFFMLMFLLALAYLLINKIPITTAIFYALSFISTTGFYTENFYDLNNHPTFILYGLAFVGGLIGSVGGGIKIFRLLMLFRIFLTELKHTLYPRMVTVIKLNGTFAPHKIIGKVLIFFFLYCSGIFAFSLILSACGISYENSAAIAFAFFTTVGIIDANLKETIFSSGIFLKIVVAFIFIILRLKIFIFFIVLQSFYEKIITSGAHSWKRQ
ncbi:MAG: hypothetical protein J6M62_08240 [Selenomonadaceae bacterium]|nr:hypothetical protein [Selenomonadaceae bacterium]MBP3721659.1 hypothetical protein [Selenomonadaceae bacterium]